MKHLLLALTVVALVVCKFANLCSNSVSAQAVTQLVDTCKDKFDPNAMTFSGKSNAQLLVEAEAGDAFAQHELGVNYYNDGDPVTARCWFLKAAKQGFARSQNELGLLYQDGEGVKQDNEKAKYWFEQAAKNGHAGGMNNLAAIYMLEGDTDKAIPWFQRSADLGYVEALYNLAMCYRDGKGVKKNLNKAKELLQTAAEKGDVMSAIELMNM